MKETTQAPKGVSEELGGEQSKGAVAREEQFRQQMTNSLTQILAQLQTMNTKVEALDQRLSRTEDRTAQLFDAFITGPTHKTV